MLLINLMRQTELDKTIAEVERELWPQLEAQFGEPIARPFRDEMRTRVIARDTEDLLSLCGGRLDGDPADKAQLIDDCRTTITSYWEVGRVFAPSPFGQPTTKATPKSRRIYRKPFERRLHLFSFVLEQKGSIEARANWGAITAAWNKAHPFHTMTLPILKVAYYKAKKDEAVTTNYVATKMAPLVARLREAAESVPQVIEQIEARRPPGCSARITLNTMVDFEERTGRSLFGEGGVSPEDVDMLFEIASEDDRRGARKG